MRPAGSGNGRVVPAFPTPDYFDEKVIGVQPGMTLLDSFAARVLPFCCLHHAASKLTEDEHADRAADHAYRIAHAMMRARRRT